MKTLNSDKYSMFAFATLPIQKVDILAMHSKTKNAQTKNKSEIIFFGLFFVMPLFYLINNNLFIRSLKGLNHSEISKL